MNKFTVLPMLLVVVMLCLVASPSFAQDMAKVASKNVKVVLDNDKVRVFDVQVKAGEKLPMHSHPSSIVIPITNGKVKTTMSDGKVKEVEFKVGEARWSDPVTHANEAVTDNRVMVIEIKDQMMMKMKKK